MDMAAEKYKIIYLNKSNLDVEIVVVDDNSPDKTYEVAKDLMKIFPGKIILHQRAGKLGLGTAYVDGLKYCKGYY